MNSVNFPLIADEEMPLWECWLERTTGIVLNGRKRLLEQGIYPRLLACGVETLEEYRTLVDSSLEGPVEKAALIDQLTVKDSSFFRNPAAMAAVGDFLRVRGYKREGSGDDLRIWSVGCALGQEAWSLAMVAEEQVVNLDVDWQVLGTDISPSALMLARDGVYSDKQMTGVSVPRRQRFFHADAQGWSMGDSLRERVRFGASNLRDIETCPYDQMDVIYCQNVLIYFRPERVHAILSELVRRLRPGGLLVLGAGEAPDWQSPWVTRWRPDTINAYRLQNGN